jgi:hypothetical protein
VSGLVTPEDAVAAVRRRLAQRRADAVCADLGIGTPVVFAVPLRPGVSTGRAVDQLGHATWHEWHMRWRRFCDRLPAGVDVVRRPVTIRGVPGDFPATLTATLDGAAALTAVPRAGTGPPTVDVDRARALASRLRAVDAVLTPATLRAVHRLRPSTWRYWSGGDLASQHPDASAWTLRQLPVPGMHTKWLDTHGSLLRDVAGRDVRDEVRPRLAVTHLTYVDPDHLASGRRRHDAWTTGDVHDVAYRPRVVLVVENRDSRLWFPPVSDTIVVEGGGKAAAALLAEVPWIRGAAHVVYWGDMDADGVPDPRPFPCRPGPALAGRCPGDTGGLHPHGRHRPAPLLPARCHPRPGGPPAHPVSGAPAAADRGEAEAYHTIATAGPTPFRRIEQEASRWPTPWPGCCRRCGARTDHRTSTRQVEPRDRDLGLACRSVFRGNNQRLPRGGAVRRSRG